MTLKTKIRGYGSPVDDDVALCRIRKACEVLNVLKRLAQWAMLFLMDYLQEIDEYLLYDPSNSRRSFLEVIFESTHGTSENSGGTLFFANLLRYLKNGKTRSDIAAFKFFKTAKNDDG